ncbi:MFS transporter [Gammaproteobacteria bacterium]|nr:MFS transporter [Gammaproteobacteria bacterium]
MERADFWRESQRTGRLPLKTKIIYALGEMPGSHMNSAIGAFLALYYNQILGVAASTIATAMGLALFLDAVSDPVVGTYSDNLKSNLGRRHPLMYAAALPLGVFMALLFSPPAGLGEEALVAWLTTFLILARLTFTCFSVPWSAMTAELTDSYSERSVVVSWRQIVGYSLGALYGFLIFTFVFGESEAFPQGQLNPENYALFAPLLGSLITVWCLITTHFTRDQVQYSYQRTDSQAFGLLVLFTSLRSALTNRNFALLLCGSLINFGVLGVLGFFDMYVNTYFWELKGRDFGIISLFYPIGPLIAVLLVMNFQAHFEKHHGLLFALIGGMIMSMVGVTARLSGLFPEYESPFFLPAITCIATINAFFAALTAIMFISMIADLVDDQELKTGQRQEGVFAAGVAFSTKAVGSLGVIVGGFLLEFFIQFPTGQGQTEISDDVLFRLAITDAIVVNSLLLIPAYLIRKYTLTRRNFATVQAALEERRESSSARRSNRYGDKSSSRAVP